MTLQATSISSAADFLKEKQNSNHKRRISVDWSEEEKDYFFNVFERTFKIYFPVTKREWPLLIDFHSHSKIMHRITRSLRLVIKDDVVKGICRIKAEHLKESSKNRRTYDAYVSDVLLPVWLMNKEYSYLTDSKFLKKFETEKNIQIYIDLTSIHKDWGDYEIAHHLKLPPKVCCNLRKKLNRKGRAKLLNQNTPNKTIGVCKNILSNPNIELVAKEIVWKNKHGN